MIGQLKPLINCLERRRLSTGLSVVERLQSPSISLSPSQPGPGLLLSSVLPVCSGTANITLSWPSQGQGAELNNNNHNHNHTSLDKHTSMDPLSPPGKRLKLEDDERRYQVTSFAPLLHPTLPPHTLILGGCWVVSQVADCQL